MNIKSLSEKVEKISACYANKFGIKRDKAWLVLKLTEEVGELTQKYLMLTGQGRNKGKSEKELRDDFAQETADVFCHILLIARHFDIDLEKEVTHKWLAWGN